MTTPVRRTRRPTVRQWKANDGTRFFAALVRPLRGEVSVVEVAIGPLDPAIPLDRLVSFPLEGAMSHDSAREVLASMSVHVLVALWRGAEKRGR